MIDPVDRPAPRTQLQLAVAGEPIVTAVNMLDNVLDVLGAVIP